MSYREMKDRKRKDYPYILEYRTRWHIFFYSWNMHVLGDDHMNNSVYNFLYDSVVNTYLIQECARHPPTSPQYGLVVHSHSDFFGSIAFPAVADLGLRVNKLGKSSVTYEVALFEQGVEDVKSVGELIHVFVDRESGRPAANGMSNSLKEGLQKLLVTKSKL
ncbi:hypothetical protein LHYA1_G001027 [Lachnellula hyalina]|uniref:Thioesterase domain-containing protein n=1 Tax=Lachnellula hyalina TaxID=1316788 RepID=A0A8H8R6T3_9HELO|nr:uncharacterized protein LHYA1_G001027 [Lachnellula hyalina]TVY29624.1 hypothetical protein LHYA1_G001027 [Lachnellula hyalina]